MSNPPTDEAAAALRIHNDARAGQNLEALVWDDDLAKQATEYAQYLADANIGLEHSSGPHDPDQGENLYMEMGQSDPVSAAAQAWINEVESYHGEAIGDGDFGSYGHYSKSLTLLCFTENEREKREESGLMERIPAQCMWSSTTKVGMGSATAANGWVFVVGRYNPQGNWTGSKPY